MGRIMGRSQDVSDPKRELIVRVSLLDSYRQQKAENCQFLEPGILSEVTRLRHESITTPLKSMHFDLTKGREWILLHSTVLACLSLFAARPWSD